MSEPTKHKKSRQRDLILKILRHTDTHPTADWIYSQARIEMPSISLGTVYRNLKLLKNEGRIREMTYGNATSRYDADLRDHYHIRCNQCGRVEDLPHDLPRTSADEIESLTGYQIYGHRLEFNGICPDCVRAENVAKAV